ncbi:hypothetical protein B0H13DRAFT_2568671 [Mycena leptocephala]|nr:hypothetical protein B0H13DRAFT_2568671 [Mycena leptocephala]
MFSYISRSLGYVIKSRPVPPIRTILTQTGASIIQLGGHFSIPWRFADFFRPGTAWNDIPTPVDRYLGLLPKKSWGKLPEELLPQPWSCSWRKWDMDLGMQLSVIPKFRNGSESHCRNRWYIALRHSDDNSTAFLGVEEHIKSPRFYLFDAPAKDLFRFEQALESIASIGAPEFVDTVNWNKMTHLGSLLDFQAIPRHRNIPGPPLLIRDLYESPWGVERRDNLEVIEALQANPAPRNWCYIPESELPESWSCSWADCFWNISMNCPNPIMFFTDWPNTVLLESGGIFYLYGQEHEELSEFYRAILGPSLTKATSVSVRWRVLLDRGFPCMCRLDKDVACGSQENRRKLTMWQMYRPPGTWRFAPRYIYKENSPVPEWDRSEDDQLPPPLCTKALTPVMFRCVPWLPEGQVAIFSSDGKYYLQDCDFKLWEFEGAYESAGDFIENADWNKMEQLEDEDCRTYEWPEDEDQGYFTNLFAQHKADVRRKIFQGSAFRRAARLRKRRGLNRHRWHGNKTKTQKNFRGLSPDKSEMKRQTIGPQRIIANTRNV